MALSLGECMAANNGGYPLHPSRRRGVFGPPGRETGMGSNRGRARTMRIIQAHEKAKANIEAALRVIDAQLKTAQGVAAGVHKQATELGGAARASGSQSAFALVQQLEDARLDIQGQFDSVEAKARQVQGRVSAVAGKPGPWAPPLEAEVLGVRDAAIAMVRSVTRKAGGLGYIASQLKSMADATKAAAAKVAADVAAAANAETARLAAIAAEKQRVIDLEYSREQDRLAREQAVVDRERAYEVQVRQDQLSREAAVRSESAAVRTGETQYQQMMLEMEQSRAQAEQEFRVRRWEAEQEREARREEQDLQLQQMLLMQELGPAFFQQQGQPQAPQQQGYAQGPPQGFAPQAPQQQGFAPAYGQQQVPYSYGASPGAPGSVAIYPGQTAPVPRAPAYGQPATSYAPQGPAGPGMEWASFSPAQEMFGMGHYGQGALRAAQGGRRHPFVGSVQAPGLGAADQSVTNSSLKGGKVEMGYNVYGPSTDTNKQAYYTFEAPDGATWEVFAADVAGPGSRPQKDPRTNRIIYVPAAGGGSAAEEDFDWGSLQKNLRQFVGTGVQAYQQVALTRAIEQGARQSAREARATGTAPVYSRQAMDLAAGGSPGLYAKPSSSGGVPTWAYGVGAAAVGLAVMAKVSSPKRRKRRRK